MADTKGSRPDPKKTDNTGWYSWPTVIVFFALGLWPIALALMFFNIFGAEKKKRRSGSVDDTVERAIARAEQRRKSAASPAPGDQVKAEPKKKDKKQKKEKKTSDPGKLLRFIGICLVAVGMLAGIDSVAGLLEGWSFYLEDLLTALAFAAAGGIMWGRGSWLRRMAHRSRRYILAIGDADAMSLAEIAKRVNRTPEKAAKELQKLIDKGWLGEDAYIDHDKGWFLRFGAAVEEPAPVRAEPPKEAEQGYSLILRNIRRANDRIADEALSRKIDRLEQISALIFREVEEHPEKRERIRTFFDYYLPTTQKLLDTYAEFEQTGVEGENLRQAKARIEQTMDAIVEGFEHQLDQLYRADAMDVATDIKVMEAMLRRDTASAARDFGYDREEAATEQTPLEL